MTFLKQGKQNRQPKARSYKSDSEVAVKHLFEKPDALQHSLKKLDSERNQLIRETTKSPEIAKSNAMLSQLFQKVATQYSKVIAVWGFGHFVVGKALFKSIGTSQNFPCYPHAKRQIPTTDTTGKGMATRRICNFNSPPCHCGLGQWY